ncbi:hypothetical protein LTR62_003642 [Meristemomyces frigidus]|uniref:glutathione-specific gamma-glutamylcyclotransferase n=1 Tax=Meristemomyces frigidus TaxID=1508187 RepID=A0AAN7TIF5_9PEZI|nr:hypothetical protein LTR62_003642 [Meristemomyces frigidus]
MASDETEDLWLFGYGSLIWKPPPHDEQVLPALTQVSPQINSEDHRGTPSAPGRVVTLIDRAHWETLTDNHASAPSKVWGAAYRIPAQHVKEVKEYLDIREVNGYSIQYVSRKTASNRIIPGAITYTPFTPAASGPKLSPTNAQQIRCLVYIGLPTNPQFLGPQDPQELAERIIASRGPSGENKDYLYELERGLEGLSEESGDEHVSDLARRCREFEAREKGA